LNAAAPPAVALDGATLAAALRTGIHRLISREELINKINVFPVPDGDTGTNLALTLQAVLVALRAGPEPHAGQLLTRVADAALDGARGNSGAILAQFLLGAGDRAAVLPALTTAEFADAMAGGAALGGPAGKVGRTRSDVGLYPGLREALKQAASDHVAALRDWFTPAPVAYADARGVTIDELFHEIDRWLADGMKRPKRLKMAKPAALAMAEASLIPLD
jgi:hypothetical protein